MPGLIGKQGVRPGALNMNRVFRALRYRTEQAQYVTFHRPPIYKTDDYGVPSGSIGSNEILVPDLPAIIRPAITADYSQERYGTNVIGAARVYTPNIETIKNTQLKSQPNPFIGGPLSPMLTEEGVEQEVEKIVDPMLRDPEILDIPPKLFDESAQQTEEALTDAEIADIASRAIDATPDADEVQPTDGKVIDLNKELDAILIAEGGYQNDKDDSGNYVNGVLIGTNRGVTPAALAKHRGVKASSITVEDIKNLTEQEARDIFKEEYFYKPKLDKLPMDLQASVFDMQINSGSNAIKILQKLVGTKQDGIIGPKTLKALEDNPVSVNEYADARIEYYNKVVAKSPEKKKFLSGWTSRANSYKV